MSDAPRPLLAHHLKQLRLPTFPSEHAKPARRCAQENVDHIGYPLRLCEREPIERERRMVERRIKAAKFPAVKSLDSFDFKAIPSFNKTQVVELTRCAYIEQRQNIMTLGPGGTGKTHIALGLGLAACRKSYKVRFTTAAGPVTELMEARHEHRMQRHLKQPAGQDLSIIDELGFVPLSKTGAELSFEVFSQRYEPGSVIVTSNLPSMSGPLMTPSQIAQAQSLSAALVRRIGGGGGAANATPAPATAARPDPSPSLVREVQELLARIGYRPGPADGLPGPRTERAVKAFQSALGLTPDGVISDELAALLRIAARSR